MSPIEVLALIFGIGLLVKLTVAIINPKPMMNLAKRFLKHKTFSTILYLVLAVIVGIYVFQSMTVIQVVSAILFGMLLLGICLVPYAGTALKIGDVILGKDMLKKDWLGLLVWVLLAVWAIVAVFA
ncbi:hypothetical protein ACFLZ6_02365 [Nanoarchaeota archaeon]